MSKSLSNIFRGKEKEQPLVPHLYKYKTRFSMLGTVGSGKTSICAALVLTAQTLSSIMPDFRCRVLESTSGILEATSQLRRGHFPPKTPMDLPAPPEAGLLLSWDSWTGSKKIQIPIVDVAGEEIQRMIQKYASGMYPTYEAYTQLSQLIRYVKDSEGFILVVPASRALIFSDDLRLEPELMGDREVDPDVPLARILESVFEHKEESGGKKIKAIRVVITKSDLILPYAQKLNMDIFDQSQNGLLRFVDSAFPSTMMTLKSFGLQNVKFYPSYINVGRLENGTIARWSDGSFKIQMHPQRIRMPEYAEKSYMDLFGDLKDFAT